MKYLFVLVALLHFSILPSVCGQTAPSTDVYSAPQDIELGLVPVSPAPSEGVALTGTVKCLVGKLTNVEIRYTSSPDLQVEGPAGPPTLATDTPLSLAIKVKSASGKADNGSWVKLHVTYLPDYAALIQAVKDDGKNYVHPGLRDQLLAFLAEQLKKAEKTTQDSGYLFPTPPFTGK